MVLDSGSLILTFDDETGALVNLITTDTEWKILDRQELGLSWRLMVPFCEELRNNNVLGEKQKLTSMEVGDGEITLVWDKVKSERAVELDIKVTLVVRVEGKQAVYYMDIENNSPYVVENVYCPYIGDMQRPKDAEWLKTFCYVYARAHEFSIWPRFDNLVGYCGVDYPTIINNGQCAGTPSVPYFIIRSENQGIYVGVKSPSTEQVAWTLELRPGYDSSINTRVPQSTDIAGKPVHVRFAALHTPYIQSGESRSLTPVALQAFRGGWQQGVDIYKEWRTSWMQPAIAPDWAREPHSWQQIHINSPEDELRMRFTELPKVAEECRKYGVRAIQFVGWNDGGQDQGNPSHDPDPRLGTFEELRQAIQKCHEIGVKIILFTKFTWADRGTEWFRKDLNRLAIKDPYGDFYVYHGYKYQTGTQLLDINTKRLIPMCFLSEEYLKLCETEFKKVVDLGAAGMLYDECQHHDPTLLCFDKNHGHRIAAPVYQNDRELIRRLRNVPGTPDDFLMSGEACYDWEMDTYQFSYHRSDDINHIPLSRYMLPHSQFMTAVTGFNDRNMINQCLIYRYVISYEPYYFKGLLSDYPDTVAYGRKMDALRTEYRKWFWDGEYRDTCEAAVVSLNGKAHHPYAVFKAADGSLGVVICNYEDEEITVTVKSNDGCVFEKYRTVDCSEWQDASDNVEIPPRSAVIVI